MNVLVINAGSSSLKYQLFEMETETLLAKGICDRIGVDGHMKHTPVSNDKPVFNEDISLPTHAEAIAAVIEKLTSVEYGVIGSLKEIGAVGHRVVHGGSKFSESVLIDDAVFAAIEACEPLAPLHTPPNVMGIRACMKAMPGVPQVAVFDTAFHQSMAERAYIYALPYEFYEKYDIRRYGFHGTSHRYVSNLAVELLGRETEGTKIISCHLGNGASLAAIKDGRCVDTTMGLTPLEGFPMGTRSGSVDPALFSVISEFAGLSIEETLDLLNTKSGVFGVSGISSDFRDLETASGIDIPTGMPIHGAPVNKRAALALDIFCYQVAKYVGAYYAIMGGADALIFTAGVGENSPYTRKRICGLLGGIGISMDVQKNKVKGPSEPLDVTAPNSRTRVFVIPTDEELVIARDTRAIIGD